MKFLFCPLASHGFVYSAIGIAQILKQRGHKVGFTTDLTFAETLKQAGCDRIPRTSKDGHSFQVGLWAKPLSVCMQLKHIQYALEQFTPDVLVTHQLTLGPLIAAEMYHLPVAILGFAAYLWPSAKSLLQRPPESEVEKRLLWRYADMMEHYNQARKLLGLPLIHRNYRETPLLGDLFLLQSVPELEKDIDDLPEQVHLIGSCLWEPPQYDQELVDWLNESDAEPIIYVQHGKSFQNPRFWTDLVTALGSLPVRVVAAVSRMDGEIGAIPKNFYVRDYLPMGLVLSRAKAVISTGHTTAVLGAVTHGLPSLLIPNGSGTEEIAARRQGAGVSLCLSAFEVTPQAIETAVETLLNCDRLQQNAQGMQQEFTKINGCVRAADLLEELAINQRPIPQAMLQSAYCE